MIDPVEFGKLQAEVAALRRDNDRQLDLLEKLDVKFESGFKTLGDTVRGMSDTMTEARGGWRLIMILGSGVAGAGGFLGWLVHEFAKR